VFTHCQLLNHDVWYDKQVRIWKEAAVAYLNIKSWESLAGKTRKSERI